MLYNSYGKDTVSHWIFGKHNELASWYNWLIHLIYSETDWTTISQQESEIIIIPIKSKCEFEGVNIK